MTAASCADWTTPRPFALPDLGPGIDGERRQALELALGEVADLRLEILLEIPLIHLANIALGDDGGAHGAPCHDDRHDKDKFGAERKGHWWGESYQLEPAALKKASRDFVFWRAKQKKVAKIG
jgi:hypothetical protein